MMKSLKFHILSVLFCLSFGFIESQGNSPNDQESDSSSIADETQSTVTMNQQDSYAPFSSNNLDLPLLLSNKAFQNLSTNDISNLRATNSSFRSTVTEENFIKLKIHRVRESIRKYCDSKTRQRILQKFLNINIVGLTPKCSESIIEYCQLGRWSNIFVDWNDKERISTEIMLRFALSCPVIVKISNISELENYPQFAQHIWALILNIIDSTIQQLTFRLRSVSNLSISVNNRDLVMNYTIKNLRTGPLKEVQLFGVPTSLAIEVLEKAPNMTHLVLTNSLDFSTRNFWNSLPTTLKSLEISTGTPIDAPLNRYFSRTSKTLKSLEIIEYNPINIPLFPVDLESLTLYVIAKKVLNPNDLRDRVPLLENLKYLMIHSSLLQYWSQRLYHFPSTLSISNDYEGSERIDLSSPEIIKRVENLELSKLTLSKDNIDAIFTGNRNSVSIISCNSRIISTNAIDLGNMNLKVHIYVGTYGLSELILSIMKQTPSLGKLEWFDYRPNPPYEISELVDSIPLNITSIDIRFIHQDALASEKILKKALISRFGNSTRSIEIIGI